MAALAASRAHKGSFSCIFIRLLPLQSAEVAGALPVFQTLMPEQVVFADFSFADHVVEFVDVVGADLFAFFKAVEDFRRGGDGGRPRGGVVCEVVAVWWCVAGGRFADGGGRWRGLRFACGKGGLQGEMFFKMIR